MESFSSLNDGDKDIRSTPLNDNQSNDNANNTSMMSMDEYKKIDKELFSGKIVKISDLSYGGFKKVYSVGDNAVACTRIDYDNNCNIVKEQVDLYDIDEIAYNAFTKVFDGMSAKIVAPCIEKKFTPLSNKLLSNNYPTLDIDFLFQCLLLNCFCPIYKTKRLKSYKDGLLQLKNKTKDKEFRDLIDNINRFIDYVLDEAEDCECTDDSNIDIPSSYLLNNEVFKKIFQFYNNYNDKFSKETKEFLGKLFCYVLFTNKMDIKLENALLDESKNNIIHIDFIPTTSNSESKYGLFDNYFMEHITNDDEVETMRDIFNAINKAFIDNYLDNIFQNDDEKILLQNLERYIITPQKIQKIIYETIKNFCRCYRNISFNDSDYIDLRKLYNNNNSLSNTNEMELKREMIRISTEKSISFIFLYYLTNCMMYNFSLIKYLMHFKSKIANSNIKNEKLNKRIDAFINIAQYNFAMLKKYVKVVYCEEESRIYPADTITNIIEQSFRHYNKLLDENKDDDTLKRSKLTNDKDIDFSSIDNLNKSIENKIKNTNDYKNLIDDIKNNEETKLKEYLKDTLHDPTLGDGELYSEVEQDYHQNFIDKNCSIMPDINYDLLYEEKCTRFINDNLKAAEEEYLKKNINDILKAVEEEDNKNINDMSEATDEELVKKNISKSMNNCNYNRKTLCIDREDEEDNENINDKLKAAEEEQVKKNINDMLEVVDEEDNIKRRTKYNGKNVFRNLDATSEHNSKYEHNFRNPPPLKKTTNIRETKNWPMFDPDNIKRFDNHNYYEIKTGNCTNAKKNIQTTHNVRQSQIETETTKIRETKNWPMFEPDNIKTSGNHNYYEIKTGNCTNAKKNIQTTHNFRQSKIETK